MIVSLKKKIKRKFVPPSANSKDYQMTEFQSENSVIWHSLELAEGGSPNTPLYPSISSLFLMRWRSHWQFRHQEGQIHLLQPSLKVDVFFHHWR